MGVLPQPVTTLSDNNDKPGGLEQQNSVSRRPRWQYSSYWRVLVLTVIAGTVAISFVLPLVWLIASSLQDERQMFARPPVWIPQPLQWQNYTEALTRARFDRFFANTVLLAVTTSLGAVLASSLAAYGFARLRWPGRDTLFFVVLCTMLLPYQATMVPLYLMFARIGWVGTYLPLIVPYWFGTPFFIFLLRQFFRSIPQDLSDAARIDGCGELGILWRVILPLARPAIAAVVLFRVLDVWGDFLEPLIYINRVEQFTLSLGLMFFTSMYNTEWNLLMAASAAVTLPVVLLFLFTQSLFIEGVTFSGLQGA